MNVATVIAQALVDAGVAEHVQVGKHMEVGTIPPQGVWSVVQEPGEPAGGNFATWKHRVPVQIRLLLKSTDGQRMYDIDEAVREAVMQIPQSNANIPFIPCSTVGDYEAEVLDARVGVWSVVATIITDGRGTT